MDIPEVQLQLFIIPILIFLIIQGLFMVKQQTAVIIERFGKFHSIRKSGIQIKIPWVDKIATKMNLRIQQLDVMVETKTKDDVFVRIKVSVQFQVLSDKVYDAYYELENPHDQITSYIFDVVRAEVPKMKLDDVFEKKDDVAIAVKREISVAMGNYGYGIVKALVTDIDPDQEVKNAMNKINSAERLKVAAQYEGDAERIRIVEKAKAEAESKRLQGQGIADQRREIARGLEDSVGVLNQAGINSQEASALIVITQHYDTLQSMGDAANSNLIMLPNAPSTASDMMTSLIASFTAAQSANDHKIKGGNKEH